MANKTLQVRLQEKIDLASTWEGKGSFVPLKGEKIVYQIPRGTSPETYDTVSKTGDGSTTLANLPFDSALAADVAPWAKPDAGEDVYRNVPQELDDYKVAVTSTYATKNELKGHPASYITSGQLALNRGGTGVALTQNPSMLVNLASTTADTVFEATPRPGVTGILPIANGGTGASTAEAARTNLDVPSKKELSDGLAGKLSTSTKYAGSSTVGGVATEAAKTTGTLTLKVAGANTKTFNGSANVELNITAQMLGIQNAVHFVGVAHADAGMKDGLTTQTIKKSDGTNHTAAAGDVVLYGENEFIWTGSEWEELGEASSLAKSITDLQTADNTINNYTITAGKGLTGTGKISTSPTLNVGAGTGITVNDDNVALATVSGLTKGSYGPTGDVNGSNGATISVPAITVDEYGRVTSISNKTYTSVNTTYNAATTSANGLMSKDDKTKLDDIAAGANVYSLASSDAYTDSNKTYTFTLTPTVNGTAGTAMSLKVPAMVGATSSAASKAGLVPVCTAANRTKFLRGDGTWVTPTNTTYNDFTTTAKGLVNPASTATPIDGENDILFNDHTWHGADDYIILCGGSASVNV